MSQLDAAELDDQLISVLNEQLLAIFKVLPTTKLLEFKPELKAALKACLWWFSVRGCGQTFGQRMLGVQYCTDSTPATSLAPRHKWTLLILCLCGEWLRDRAHHLASLARLPLTPRSIERLLGWVSAAASALSLLNFTAFLLQGHHCTLTEQLARVTVCPTRPQALRSPSYHLMNREIMWHGFSELIFFLLPHINTFAVRNWLRRLALPLSHQPNPSLCAYCSHPPTMAQIASCGHMYCYYCLQANCMADPGFTCTLCSHKIVPHR